MMTHTPMSIFRFVLFPILPLFGSFHAPLPFSHMTHYDSFPPNDVIVWFVLVRSLVTDVTVTVTPVISI